MDEQYIIEMDGPARAAAESPGSLPGEAPQDIIACLDSQPDETLRDLIGRATFLLAARKNKRQEQALAAIRRLAKEHGLDVQASKRGRQRGRPRKAIAGS